MGRVFCVLHIPTLPAHAPPLVRPLMARRRHFCARVQRGRGEAKKQNLRKGHLQARRAVLMSVSVLIFPRSKTSHSAPQSARHDIKQPRPTPPGASRGVFIFCGPGRGPRSAPPSHPTRRSGGHCIQSRSAFSPPRPNFLGLRHIQLLAGDTAYSR